MTRFPRVAWTIPLAILAGGLAMRAELPFAPPLAHAGLAQPLPIATAWGGFGALLLATLVGALALAGWGYLCTMRQLTHAESPSLRAALGVVALALLAAWLVPVAFSSDVYAYAAYGEMARVGISPYAHVTLPLSDPLFRLASFQWGDPPPACVYGPLFVAIAAVTLELARPFGPLGQLDALRLVAAVGLLALAVAAWLVYPGDRRARLRAATLIALNPVAIWCAAEGHNDALALAIGLTGIAVARRGFGAAGGAIAALGGWIKLPAVLAAVGCWREPRARWGAGVAAVVVLASAVPMLLAAAAHAGHGGYAPQASLQGLVAAALPAAPPSWVVAVAVLAALACAWRGVHALRRGEPSGWAWLAVGGWVLVPNPYPWYGLWLLPIAALAPAGSEAALLTGLSFAMLARYAPDALGQLAPALRAVLAGIAIAPLLIWLARSAIIGRSHDRNPIRETDA